jgi:hypothetical protein
MSSSIEIPAQFIFVIMWNKILSPDLEAFGTIY